MHIPIDNPLRSEYNEIQVEDVPVGTAAGAGPDSTGIGNTGTMAFTSGRRFIPALLLVSAFLFP